MKKLFRLPAPRSPLPLLACLLVTCMACSQNEFTWEGQKPPAPKSARNAHVIKKEGSGMNAVGAMEEASAAPTAGKVFRGTATLSREAEAKFKPGASLFVIARSLDGHPVPVAAIKLKVEKFPVGFELTQQDAMDAAQLPNDVDILVRLDDDGDLKTQHDGDMVSKPVKATAGEPFTVLLTLLPSK